MKQTLTDDEIEVYQNFDSIIKQTRAHSGKWVYYAGGTFVVAVLIVSIWWKNHPVTAPNSVKIDEPAIPRIPEVNKPELINLDSVQAVVAEKQPLPKKKISKPDAKTFSEEKPKPVGYKQAEPAGGYEKLYDYFNHELQYPESALRDSIQGVVVIDFVINVSGKPEQIQIQQSLDKACDMEAKRVIESMDPWLPASLNGKPVPARVSVPVTFQLLKPKQE
ncbi:MAG: TonB family protein [Cyclobacteriaceae bacterium]|nr:TonB family protein [Cyclobacteriaceae bacterium]